MKECQGALRELLMKVKSPQPELLKKEVVYKVPCMNCDGSHSKLERQTVD